MQENMSELARKYREEMLRMYGGIRQAVPQPAAPMPAEPLDPPMPAPMEQPEPMPIPLEETLTPEEALEEWMNAPEMQEAVNEQVQENLEEEQLASEDPEGTIYEEPVLPEYIRPGQPQPSPVPPEPAYTEHGLLYVAAVTGNGAFPVEGAHVTVVQHLPDGEQLVHLMITDESGETPVFPIPTPDASLSQTPGNSRPYVLCDIRIFARGYFRNEALNVPIFSGVTSRQVFRMIPLPLIMHEDMETIRFPSEAPNP